MSAAQPKRSTPGSPQATRALCLLAALAALLCLALPALADTPDPATLPIPFSAHAPLQPQANLKCVARGGSLWVAVGDAGVIRTSPDGSAWSPATSGTTANLTGVAWGGGLFVAVGAGGTLLSSADGRSWTRRGSGTSQALSGVCYGGSGFVAVGNQVVLASSDGATWNSRSTGGTSPLSRVTWGNQQYVAVGGDYNNGGVILTSPDALTWTRRSSGLPQVSLSSVVWANRFVAGASDGSILTSPDGTSWTRQNSGTPYGIFALAWGSGRFVATGYAGTLLFSYDGISWLAGSSGTGASLNGVVWYQDRFLAVGDAGSVLQSGVVTGNCGSALDAAGISFGWTGGDAAAAVSVGTGCAWSVAAPVSWVTPTSPISGSGVGTVAFRVAANSGPARSALLTIAGHHYLVSQEAAHFSVRAEVTGTGGSLSCGGDVVYGADAYCSIGAASGFGLAQLTDNGSAVTSQVAGSTYRIPAVSGDHLVVASFADTSAPAVTSFSLPGSVPTLTLPISSFSATDNVGVTGYLIGESPSPPSPSYPRWKASPPLQYTASGTGPRTLYAWARDAAGNVSASATARVVVTSLSYAELDSFTAVAAGTAGSLNDIAYGPSGFEVAGTGLILSSPDGVAWSLRSFPTGSAIRGIAIGEGSLAAVGLRSGYASGDGSFWSTTGDNPALPSFRKVAYGAGLFAATSDTGDIWTSPDGLAWTLRFNAGQILEGIAWGNGRFVALGPTGACASSPDGIAWTGTPLPTSFTLKSVVWGGDQFVAVGGGVIATSPDGVSWSKQVALDPSVLSLSAVTRGAELYVAVGAQVYTSPDGVAWTRRPAPPPEYLNGVAFGAGRFAAVGSRGNVYLTAPVTAGCSYAVSASALSFEKGSGSADIFVTAGADCPWNAYSDSPWIAASPGSGSGSGGLSVSVAPNPGNARIGTLLVAGEAVTVRQKAGADQELTVALSGNGSGSVTSIPGGIACAGGSCSAGFPADSAVTLVAAGSGNSFFAGWSGACSAEDGDCTVTMSEPAGVGASFQVLPSLKRSGTPPQYFGSFADAYASIANGGSAELSAQSLQFSEPLSLFRDVSLTFTGGFDGRFTAQTGSSVFHGPLIIRKGTLTADRLLLR